MLHVIDLLIQLLLLFLSLCRYYFIASLLMLIFTVERAFLLSCVPRLTWFSASQIQNNLLSAPEKPQWYKPPQVSIGMSVHLCLHSMVVFMLQFAFSQSTRRIRKVHCSSILKHSAPPFQAGKVVYREFIAVIMRSMVRHARFKL